MLDPLHDGKQLKSLPIVCSFSGGETSAYMSIKLKEKYGARVHFVFANTSQENEETLEFVDQVDKAYGLGVTWIEAAINPIKGKGTTYTITNFKDAKRNGEVFEAMIAVYGLPNPVRMYCTRELKTVPLTKYKNDVFNRCLTAIGIRSDEMDRVNPNYVEKDLYYPLVFEFPTTKNEINCFWRDQEFRLNLKHYEGNCKWCFKKSINKLKYIAKVNPGHFDFPERMEKEHATTNWTEHGNDGVSLIFRERRTVQDIRDLSVGAIEPVDEAQLYEVQGNLFVNIDDDDLDACGSESCEAF